MFGLNRKPDHPVSAEPPEDFRLLAIADIAPDPYQPRKIFELDKLRELANSIAQYGVLSPLMVRRDTVGYRLIAGERRLRAASMAGLTHVPCIIRQEAGQEAALLSLIENLQRRDLDFFEEAAGLARLMAEFHLTQEEIARRLGRSQPAVANKLRLLRLEGDIMSRIREAGLTERHARVLLRLRDSAQIRSALSHIIVHQLSVAESEAYVTGLCRPPEPPRPTCKPVIRDVRLFINTVQNAIKTMSDGGVHAVMERQEQEDSIVLTIRLPKRTDRSPAPSALVPTDLAAALVPTDPVPILVPTEPGAAKPAPAALAVPT